MRNNSINEKSCVHFAVLSRSNRPDSPSFHLPSIYPILFWFPTFLLSSSQPSRRRLDRVHEWSISDINSVISKFSVVSMKVIPHIITCFRAFYPYFHINNQTKSISEFKFFLIGAIKANNVEYNHCALPTLHIRFSKKLYFYVS